MTLWASDPFLVWEQPASNAPDRANNKAIGQWLFTRGLVASFTGSFPFGAVRLYAITYSNLSKPPDMLQI